MTQPYADTAEAYFDAVAGISYSAAHRRVRKARGGAETHACEHCGEPAAEW